MRSGLWLCALIGLWTSPVAADIVSAEYTQPTTRYDHGILGDRVEYGALRIITDTQSGSAPLGQITIVLPWDHVFEDITPRLADIDNDGDLEVIVIETDISKGAAIAIYDETGKITETQHIGSTHRWLAPIGIADFNGDGDVDIAYVDRPHLAKKMRVVSYRDGRLVKVAKASKLTNHKIGWDFIAGGVRDCGSGPEMITADGAWRNIVATQLVGRNLVSEKIGTYNGPDSLNAALSC